MSFDAISSSLADELTLLSGFRSTRVTTQPSIETQVASGFYNAATSGGGITVNLSSSTFGSAVAGQIFRVLSGRYRFREAEIAAVVGPTQITLVTPGIVVDTANFSWEIVEPSDVVLNVESVLDWSASGVVFVDGVEYRYATRSNTQLQGLTFDAPRRAFAYISTSAGSSIVDGATFTIADGRGKTITFEFDSTGAWDTRNRVISFTAFMTATDVRDAIIYEIGQVGFAFAVSAEDTNVIYITHNFEGDAYNTAITQTGTTGLTINGFEGGRRSVSGLRQAHAPLSEVMDYTREYSAGDIFRASFLLDLATGEDLATFATIYGIPYPEGLPDDTIREILRLCIYGKRGTRLLIDRVLNVALGAGNWAKLVDETGDSTVTSGGRIVFPENTLNNPATLYLLNRRGVAREGAGWFSFREELIPAGLTFTVGAAPTGVSGILPSDNSSFGQRIFQGTITGPITTTTITDTGANFGRVRGGDYIYIRHSAFRDICLVASNTVSATSITYIGQQAGLSVLDANPNTGTMTGPFSVEIIRPETNVRYNRPSALAHILSDNTTTRTDWVYSSTGAETTYVIPVTGADNYIRILPRGAAGGVGYYHELNYVPEFATCRIQALFRVAGTFNVAPDYTQVFFQFSDTYFNYRVGFVESGGVIYAFAINDSNIVVSTGTPQVISTTDWNELEIVVSGTAARRHVKIVINGSIDYNDDPSGDFTPTILPTPTVFVATNNFVGSTAELQLKDVSIGTTDQMDVGRMFVYNTDNVGPVFEDADARGLFVGTDVDNTFTILESDGVNAGGGANVGDWQAVVITDPDTITLDGRIYRNGATVNAGQPDIIDLGDFPLRWPHCLGHNFEILDGPNAAIYSIDEGLHSSDQVTFTLPFTGTASPDRYAAGFEESVRYIRLTPDLPAPADNTRFRWRLIPVFGTATGQYSVMDNTLAVLGTSVIRREPLRITLPDIYNVAYNTFPSNQVHQSSDVNTFVGPDMSLYPAYIPDTWGTLRALIEILVAAGIKVDFDRLVEDAAGLHII